MATVAAHVASFVAALPKGPAAGSTRPRPARALVTPSASSARYNFGRRSANWSNCSPADQAWHQGRCGSSGATADWFNDWASRHRTWGPFMDELFGGACGPAQRDEYAWPLMVDRFEEDDSFVFQVDLPGVRSKDVSVEVSPDGVLTIAGQRRRPDARGERPPASARMERRFGRAARRVRLPDSAQAEGITACLDAGVLTVRVPKAEAAKPRSVKINVAGGGSARGEAQALAPVASVGGDQEHAGQTDQATQAEKAPQTPPGGADAPPTPPSPADEGPAFL